MKAKKIIFVLIAMAGLAYTQTGAAFPRLWSFGQDNDASDILKTIDKRMSNREFSDKEIDSKIMDEILWSAFGKNSRGTRTIPTAQNAQRLKVFAIRADGAFLYDGEKLDKVSDKDLRPLFAQQAFVLDAPLTLLFVGNDKQYSPMHAGSSYQNVSLYCAERGLNQVVRAYFDKSAVQQALGLSKDEFAIISQTIGWKKQTIATAP